MKRNFTLFFLFAKNALATTSQGRTGIVLLLLGKIIRFIFLFFLLFFIFQRTQFLKGYSFSQAALFYLVFNLIDTLSQVLFREVYRFRYLVTTGGLDMVLLKPYHPFLRILLGGVDLLDLILIVPYLILTVIAAHSIATTPVQIFIFILLFLNAIWIATSFHIIVLALGILTTEVDHTILIYRDMTSLGRFPMDIYKEPIKSFFTFIIPVAVMMSYPVQALVGKLSLPFTGLAFVLSSSICFGALKLWSVALEKYQSWGG